MLFTRGALRTPPVRAGREPDDVEALWEHLLDGTVDWVVSDHACCREEVKFGEPEDDVFLAKAGFGGAEYLLTDAFLRGNHIVRAGKVVGPPLGAYLHRPTGTA
ncbi:hypothetical protein [Streptomyces hebeiensis]